jgi:thiamine-phosphate pyrophosphorylase
LKLPRLYPILDTALLGARGCTLETAAAAMLSAGAGILQIRHKGAWTGDIFEQAERVARLCKDAGTPLVINDRADIALLLGAGLHVGQDDLSPVEARRLIGPDAMLGYSTHNENQVAGAAAEPVSYVAIGPMFATQSKANPDPVVGVERLVGLRRLTEHPLVAIGGITRGNARSVLDAGADSVAVIGDLLPVERSAARIRERMEEWGRTVGQVGERGTAS